MISSQDGTEARRPRWAFLPRPRAGGSAGRCSSAAGPGWPWGSLWTGAAGSLARAAGRWGAGLGSAGACAAGAGGWEGGGRRAPGAAPARWARAHHGTRPARPPGPAREYSPRPVRRAAPGADPEPGRARPPARPAAGGEPSGGAGGRGPGRRRQRTPGGRRHLGLRQRQPGRVVVGRRHVPAPGVEQPLGDVQPAAGPGRQLTLPAPVTVLAGIPLRVFGVRAQLGEPDADDVSEPGPGGRVTLPAHRCVLRLLGHVPSLGQHGSLEPADSFDRDPSRVGDLLDRLPGANTGLDLLGSQGILHFDLVLGEPGELTFGDRPQPVVDGQHETPAPARNGENGVAAVFAYRDEAQFLHGRPFPFSRVSGGPSPDLVRYQAPGTSLPVKGISGQHLARHVPSSPRYSPAGRRWAGRPAAATAGPATSSSGRAGPR